MGYFPFFINIANKEFLIVGGGNIAYRKIKSLLEFNASITIVSDLFIDEILDLSKNHNISLIQKVYAEIDLNLKDYFCVISATDDAVVNSNISKACLERNILVNIADDIDKCNFIFPAIVKDEDIIIGITTSGKSPIISKVIKNNVKSSLPSFYGDLVVKLGNEREKIKKAVKNEKNRKKILQQLTKLGLEKQGNISEVDTLKIINTFDMKGN